MKKALQISGALVCAIVVLGISSGKVFARVNGSQPSTPDYACYLVGGSTELCFDSSLNLVPTVDNTQTLGTSALRFATLNALDGVFGDDVTVADDSTIAGDSFKTMVATQTVALSGTISVAGACGGILRLTAAGSDITVAGFTTPAAANAGCILYVVNVGSSGGGTIGIVTSATFSAPYFELVAGNPGVLLGTNDAIIVGQIGSTWVALGTVVINS